MTSRHRVTGGPAPAGPYAPAVRAGELVYLSGIRSAEGEGPPAAGSVTAQTRGVLARMDELLRAAGSSLAQAAKVTVYLRSAADFPAMNAVYREAWSAAPPARTTIVCDLAEPAALVEMSAVAVVDRAPREVVHPSSWMPSPNPYSYAVLAGDTLFLSGLVSRSGRDNAAVGGDVATQTRVVMDNAAAILAAAGMGFDHVVSARVYLPDPSGFEAMNGVYRTCFPSAPPARATVHTALAGSSYNVEITLIASRAPKQVVADGRPANPNLSPAVLAGNTLYLSGMLGHSPASAGDVAAQTRETLARLERTMEAAGFSRGSVVDALVYLPELSAAEIVNREYRAFFGNSFPARTLVRTGLFASGALVEIMMTAARG